MFAWLLAIRRQFSVSPRDGARQRRLRASRDEGTSLEGAVGGKAPDGGEHPRRASPTSRHHRAARPVAEDRRTIRSGSVRHACSAAEGMSGICREWRSFDDTQSARNWPCRTQRRQRRRRVQ